MTVTLQWWYLPVLLVVAAFGLPALLRSQGDYDFGTPLIQLAIFGACIAGAIGVTVGYLFR